MNGLPGDVILVGIEVRDLETADGVDRDRERLRGFLRSARSSQLTLRLAQRAQDLRAVEPLPLTMFAEAHRDPGAPLMDVRYYAQSGLDNLCPA